MWLNIVIFSKNQTNRFLYYFQQLLDIINVQLASAEIINKYISASINYWNTPLVTTMFLDKRLVL